MRHFDRTALLGALLLGASACSVRLDHLPTAAPANDAGVPTVGGCRLFHSGATSSVGGRASSVVVPDGRALWIVGAVRTAGGQSVTNAGAWVAPGASVTGCFAGASWVGANGPRSVLSPSPLGADTTLEALAPIRAGDAIYLYYSISRPAPGEPFGSHLMGYGIARWDPAGDRFVPTNELLWTGDRPDYGAAVVLDGATAYVYGCKSNGSLKDDCFVARAPVDRLDDASAYQYSVGGGHWSAQADDAWPVVSGVGDPVSVVRDAARQRYVMAYLSPLGDTLTVRSGLGPDGPWSSAFGVARCELPDKDAFCTGVALHPELGSQSPSGSAALSYALSTFTPRAAEASPEGYWSRLVMLPLPGDLP